MTNVVHSNRFAQSWESRFEEWWEHAPRKVSKRQAKVTFAKLPKRYPAIPQDQLFRLVVAATIWFTENEWKGRERKHVPHPSTFLNDNEFDPLSVKEMLGAKWTK